MSGVTMVSTAKADRAGWGWPGNARKAHYFHNSKISACGHWFYGGTVTLDNGKPSPDDCVACRKWLSKNPPAAEPS